MKRNNPSSATSPNAPIDLTSLLDIVFIFLFVAIIGIKKNNQDIDTVTASMNSIIVEKDSENSTLMAENKALAIENEELKSLVDEYYVSIDESIENEYKEQYARLGERISILTIRCDYKYDYVDAEDFRTNYMTLAIDGKQYEDRFDFQANNDVGVSEQFDKLRKTIKWYVELHTDKIIIVEIKGRQVNEIAKKLNDLHKQIADEYPQVF